VSKPVDYSGTIINNRLLLRKIGHRHVKGRKTGNAVYECQCKCGRIGTATRANLKLSYGCRICRAALRTHGKSKTLEYTMLCSAKERAKRDQISLNITIEDIIIPERCPLLDIPLFVGTRSNHDNSPSPDRIVPEQGYVKGNIRVISHRANSLKRDSALDELETLVKNWRALCGSSSQQI
jgi:hypothetical protein